jgi:hypothetical protein
MKRVLAILGAAVVVVSVAGVAAFGVLHTRSAHAGAVCTPTGYYRDGINMTALLVNPTGTVSGTINATGCNVAVYYGPGATGTVDGAEIYGANYFGVLNNGGSVTVRNANIHDIGEVPFNGSQHGVGVYFVYDTGATGAVLNSHVWRYQKGGIVVNGPSDSATVANNVVNGLGPVNFIAQNGIQFGWGAEGTITHNIVTGNAYTLLSIWDSEGILVFGGPGVGATYTTNMQIANNTATGNDVGIDMGNYSDGVTPAPKSTNNKVINNTVSNDAITNNACFGTIVNGTCVGGLFHYQVGISNYGDTNDKVIGNTVTGVGYTPIPNSYVMPLDIENVGKTHVEANATI